MDPLTGMEASRLGLYVHFPYCLAKCPYCDFAVTLSKRIPQERYTEAILAELALRQPSLAGRPAFDSVFIGGGTPSLWTPRQLARVLEAVARSVGIAPGAEISLEANPEVASAAALAGLRAAGVNRLSFGVQSFTPAILSLLGRTHSPEQAEQAVQHARAAGFRNVSVDLIYGVPGQTVRQVEEDVARLVGLAPEHVSTYALTLDRESLAQEVPLGRRVRRGELALPPEQSVLDMVETLERRLEEAGLARYEISNHARPGYASSHNALYWTGGECLALGTGATGLLYQAPQQARRWSNLRSTERYLSAVEAGRLPEGDEERLGPTELFEERLAMGLRLTSGVALVELCRDFQVPLEPRLAQVRGLEAAGLARWQGPRLALTPRGLQLHSEISARLI